MAFDAMKFLRDFRVPYVTSGHKHCQEGWVQVACPFCTGNIGWHLGYNFSDDYWNCWRCGFHSHYEIVKHFAKANPSNVKEILRSYGGRISHDQVKKVRGGAETCVLPIKCGELKGRHRDYLESRGFDPDEIIRLWDIKGTGNTGPYRFRIIAPIYFNGELVSFQGRDITGRQELKYKAAKMDNEVLHHKDILYGWDAAYGDTVALTEGITDVWKLGPGTLACFGIKYRLPQVHLIAKRFKRVFLIFDRASDTSEEREARNQEQKIGEALDSLGVEALSYDIGSGDPGDLSRDEARAVMREIGLQGSVRSYLKRK